MTTTEGEAAKNARRQRVRLVRRFAKWLAKLDSMASDTAKLKREGTPIPRDWNFDYDGLLSLLNPARRYVFDAMESATERRPAAESYTEYVAVRYVRDGLDKKKLARLIDSGALDYLGHTRATLHANADYVLLRAQTKAREAANGGCNFFGLMAEGRETFDDSELKIIRE